MIAASTAAAKPPRLRLLRRLWADYLKPRRGLIALALACAVGVALCSAALAKVLNRR